MRNAAHRQRLPPSPAATAGRSVLHVRDGEAFSGAPEVGAAKQEELSAQGRSAVAGGQDERHNDVKDFRDWMRGGQRLNCVLPRG